jgi:hypothetical protein
MADLKQDYGAACDETETALAVARTTRDDAMAAIEASRHGVLELCPDDYLAMKIIHGEAKADVVRERDNVAHYKSLYYAALTSQWMAAQYGVAGRKVPLVALWRLWRDVRAAWMAWGDLVVIVPRPGTEGTTGPAKLYYEDDFGQDKFETYVGTARQRAEAQAATEEAEGLYDMVARTFHGWPPRKNALNIKVKPPVRAEPTPAQKIQNRHRRRFAKRGAFERSPA